MARLNRLETGSDSARAAVGVNATAVMVADRRSNRVSLVIRNHGAKTIYFGNNSLVTSTSGYPVLAGEEYVFDDYTGQVWVVADGADTSNIRAFEVF